MKKSFLYMAACAALFGGCQKEVSTENPENNENTFTATFESNETRAYLDDDDYCRWELNDQVSLFNNDGVHYAYYSTKGNVTTTQLTTKDEPEFSGENIYAIFPYNAANKLVDGQLTSVIPAEQVYDKEKVNLNNAIMVSKIAVAPKKHFSFKNSCALVKVQLNTLSDYASGEAAFSINSIKLTSKANNLAGDVSIADDFVATVAGNGAKSVTLVGCGEAGQMTADYRSFVMVIPAGDYKAGDLTIAIDATNDDFDCEVTLGRDLIVGRSQYVTLHTTLTRADDKFVNKAIMADIPRLKAQNFSNICEDVEYALPDNNFTINGEGGVYDFVTVSEDGELVYIMNTFTTSASGVKNSYEAPMVTVNDITITGTLRGSSMGIWVSNYKYQCHFCTVFNNVHIVNNNIIPWTDEEGTALAIFGSAELNNCSVFGTRYTEEYEESPQILSDVTVRNRAIATFNGGNYGFVHGKEQSKITVKGGAVIDKLYSVAINQSSLGFLSIENAIIREVVVDPSGNYQPETTISKDAVVTTLKFIGVTNFSKVTISDEATIGEIYVDETRYATIAEFKQAVGI